MKLPEEKRVRWTPGADSAESRGPMETTEGIQRQRRRFQVSLPLWVRPRPGRRDRSSSAVSTIKPSLTSRDSRLHLEPGKLPEVENTSTENISTAGCYFLSSKELAVGSKIEMEIVMPASAALPRRAKVRCWGQVVRVERIWRRGRIGIACTIDHYRFLQQFAASKGIPNWSPQQLQA